MVRAGSGGNFSRPNQPAPLHGGVLVRAGSGGKSQGYSLASALSQFVRGGHVKAIDACFNEGAVGSFSCNPDCEASSGAGDSSSDEWSHASPGEGRDENTAEDEDADARQIFV